jgi:protein-disulfide isomerase
LARTHSIDRIDLTALLLQHVDKKRTKHPHSKGNSLKNLRLILTAALFLPLPSAVLAQTPAAMPAAPAPQAPSAPTAPADPLPPTNPRFFTATTPSLDTIGSFLKALWGFDPNRVWRIMAVQTTPAPNVTKVVVFVTDKSPGAKIASTAFYVTPDGKHAIGEGAGVIPFAANPFAETRALLQAKADGATRGAAGKGLLLVEFADLQCPHCKEAQETMANIVKDFPDARVVFQLFPLVDIHPSAFKAAAYGVCVQKQNNDAFFKYADGVFDTQDALTPATEDTVLAAAVTRAGLDPAAIAACAATQATKDTVNADIKLAEDAGVDQTPLLSINGRLIPITQIPYESIKQIIAFQAGMDGVPTGASAETLTPKPVQPTMTTLPK